MKGADGSYRTRLVRSDRSLVMRGRAMIPLHEHVLDRLNAYLDRTLSPADSSVVRRHCESCPSCRAALESLGGALGPCRRCRGIQARYGRLGLRGLRRGGSGLGDLLADLGGGGRGPGRVPRLLLDAEAIAVRPSRAGSTAVDAGHGRGASPAGAAARRRPGAGRPGHRRTGRARASGGDRRVRLASLTTGEHGEAVPRFRLPDWPDGSYRLLGHGQPARVARSPRAITRTSSRSSTPGG